MKWYYLNTGEGTGKFNMEFDKYLCNNCGQDEAFFRLYRWKPYCISLGANQDIKSVDVNKALQDGIETVYRPTGGRAVLHAEELTYSVVIPSVKISSVKEIYRRINLALAEGLKKYNGMLSAAELESEQPNLSDFYKSKQGNICFAVPSKSELKYKGKKLAGSAQRRMENIILQHGSILCGAFHRKLTSYLFLSKDEIASIENEMESKTVELETILCEEINYERLSLALLAGFEHHFSQNFLIMDYSEIFPDKEKVNPL